MGEKALRVEGLGKRYRIGTHQPYYTLRESLTRGVTSPLRGMQNFFRNGKNHVERASPADLWNGSPDKTIWALRDVSFDINQGQVVGVIGRNGAGKSTLLKILTRITAPSEGEVEVFGRVGSLLEVGTGFHPELTGRENIYLNGAILGMRSSEIARKFDEIVAFAEIENFIDTPVKRYSSGMYMRLAFSVAAYLEPDVLVVDEVLSVGDAAFQKKCLGKMGDVARRGRTVLFVSHQMFAMRTLCERALWLDGGRLIKDGPAFEVVLACERSLLNESRANAAVINRELQEVQETPFYIRQIQICDSQTQATTNVISYSQTMNLLIFLAGTCPTREYGIEFRIYKDTGEFACIGASDLLHGIYFDGGIASVRVDVGPLFLTNGTYTISFRVTTRAGIVDNWDQACSFWIVGCHPFSVPREIKTPVCVVQHTFSALR
jgi:lipopolysaccharide transport system ATP-binding protein